MISSAVRRAALARGAVAVSFVGASCRNPRRAQSGFGGGSDLGGRGGLGGSAATGTWIRSIPDPDANGIGDHEGLTQWFTAYATNSYPANTRWVRKATSAGPFAGGTGTDNDVNRQKAYGYKYLEWESLHGGYFNCTTNPPATTAIGDLTAAGIDRYYAGDSLAALSAGGYVLGCRCGNLFGKKAEAAGGLVLIGIGLKILAEDIFF